MRLRNQLATQLTASGGPASVVLLANPALLETWIHRVCVALARLRRAGVGTLVAYLTSGNVDGTGVRATAVRSEEDKPKFLIGTGPEAEPAPKGFVCILVPTNATPEQRRELRAVPGQGTVEF